MHNTFAPYDSPTYCPRLFMTIFVIALVLSGCAALDKTSPPVSDKTGNTRTYYIAAEDVLWDYAPSYPINGMTGKPFTKDAKVFVEGDGNRRIGHKYWKALYREYTDETFTTPKPRAPKWKHLGTLGPVVRGVVNDTIVVVFKNMTADKRLSVHPHGLFYDKSSEGTPYDDGTSNKDKLDDGVTPGAIHKYTWKVPERAGPTENDPSSIIWMYHSHVDEPADTNAGLIVAPSSSLGMMPPRRMARRRTSIGSLSIYLPYSMKMPHFIETGISKSSHPAQILKTRIFKRVT